MTEDSEVPERRRVAVSAEQTIFTHNYLWLGALDALDRAEQEPRGSSFQSMHAILGAAFALEAYLNHICNTRLPYWDDGFTIKANYKMKLKLILFQLELQSDFDRPPLKTIQELFKLRNRLVHGKTYRERASNVQHLWPHEDPVLPEPGWMKQISPQRARIYCDAVQEVSNIISSHLPPPMRFGDMIDGHISSGLARTQQT